MKILITSGGTKVPIDSVRDITNMSNGTFGAKIAREALIAGAEVVFFKAKRSKTPFSDTFDFYHNGETPKRFADWDEAVNRFAELFNFAESHRKRYKEVGFRSFSDYFRPLEMLLRMEKPDIVILAAAVSDFLVSNVVNGKVRSRSDYEIQLEEAPKVISQVKQWAPDVLLVGFKLLVNSDREELIQAAVDSVSKNGCDLVVANDLADIRSNSHTLLLVQAGQETETMKTNPDDPNFLARMVVERSIKAWQRKRSSSGSPAA